MKINIANLGINIELLYDLPNIENYKTNSETKFNIISLKEDFNYELNNLISSNDYYDLYETNHLRIMKVKSGGYVVFNDKDIKLYPTSKENEYLLCQYALNDLIVKYAHGILFHSSIINYNGIGIAFTAPSGTGKSTQRRLWEKYTNAICINDDKNLITVDDGKVIAWPSPWSGKHHKDNNIPTELKYIVFISQAKENKLEEISSIKAFKLLLHQVGLPYLDAKETWNRGVDALLNLKLYSLSCTISEEAVNILKKEVDKNANQ